MQLTDLNEERYAGEWLAILFLTVIVGTLALVLATVGPARGEQFTPGTIYQITEGEEFMADPDQCQGEGLVDSTNRAVLAENVVSTDAFCTSMAYPAMLDDGWNDRNLAY